MATTKGTLVILLPLLLIPSQAFRQARGRRSEVSSLNAATSWCSLPGVAADEGATIGSTDPRSLQECERLCDNDSNCNSITNCPAYGGCWLKDKVITEDTQHEINADCKTYYKSDTCQPDVAASWCSLPGLATDEGAQVGSASSLQECERLCNNNPSCNSISNCPAFGGCWLKNKVITESTQHKFNGGCKTYYKNSTCLHSVSRPDDIVEYLNENYLSYDPEDPASKPGVVMRGQPRFGEWLWCTGECHNGQADCIVSASLLNHRIMISSENRVKPPMDYALGVIFEPEAFESTLAKCYYEFDGASWNRVNGGCGSGAGNSCSDWGSSAFANLCPGTNQGASKAGCSAVERASCDFAKQHGGLPKYPTICHWKGPAYHSSASPGEEADLTPSGFNQLREMIDQRLSHQDGDCAGRPCSEFWNEMVIDGKVLKKMLAADASSAIAAFSYHKGSRWSFNEANKLNDKLKQEYGKTVPIVALDLGVQVSAQTGMGPFSHPEW